MGEIRYSPGVLFTEEAVSATRGDCKDCHVRRFPFLRFPLARALGNKKYLFFVKSPATAFLRLFLSVLPRVPFLVSLMKP